MHNLLQAAAQVRIRRDGIGRIAFAKRDRLLHRYERSLLVVGFEVPDAVFETVTDCREKAVTGSSSGSFTRIMGTTVSPFDWLR